jgi:hypothetical protein
VKSKRVSCLSRIWNAITSCPACLRRESASLISSNGEKKSLTIATIQRLVTLARNCSTARGKSVGFFLFASSDRMRRERTHNLTPRPLTAGTTHARADLVRVHDQARRDRLARSVTYEMAAARAVAWSNLLQCGRPSGLSVCPSAAGVFEGATAIHHRPRRVDEVMRSRLVSCWYCLRWSLSVRP